MNDPSTSPVESENRKLSWPWLSLVVSVLLWLLAWEVIVWFVPVQPRAVLRTSDRLHGFSPDGQTLVTGLQRDSFLTGQIRLWDANSGIELEVVGEAGINLLPNVAYLGQRDLLYENRLIEIDTSETRRITLVLYDLTTRRETCLIHLDFIDLLTCYSLCFTSDGRTLAICMSQEFKDNADVTGNLRLIDVATGRARVHLEGGGFRELVFSPDGNTLAMMHDPPIPDGKEREDVAIVLLNTATGQTRKTIRIGGGGLFPLDFSPNGQKFATFCFKSERTADGFKDEVNIWDLTGENTMSLKGERFAAFFLGGKGLATCDEDRHRIRFLEESTGKELAVFNNLFSYDWCPTFFMPIPGSHLFVIPTTHDVKTNPFLQWWGPLLGAKGLGAERHDVELAFLDTRTGKKAASIVREGMGDLKISVDGKTLAVPSFDEDDKFIEIWDIPPRKPLRWVLGVLAIPSVVTVIAFRKWWKGRIRFSH